MALFYHAGRFTCNLEAVFVRCNGFILERYHLQQQEMDERSEKYEKSY